MKFGVLLKFKETQIVNKPQILKELQISIETQITNEPKILNEPQISKQTQITNDPQILK